jgi:hypothetical protein
MSLHHENSEAGQDNVEGSPDFRVVRRGYDRDEVDAYFPSSPRSCGRRSTTAPPRNGQGAELQAEVTSSRERRSPMRALRHQAWGAASQQSGSPESGM